MRGGMPKVTEQGKWYFVVDCSTCSEPIPLAEAPSPEQKPDPLQYRTISVTCPHCSIFGAYSRVKISRRLVL